VSRLRRLWRLTTLIGPRPLLLAQTFCFLVLRSFRRRRLRRLYKRPLRAASVDLHLPTVGLSPFDQLSPPLQNAASGLREEADQICAHRVDLLGSGLFDLGPQIDWHRDFKSGYRWPADFYKELEVTRSYDRSDAKVPWELSRCHQFLTLARAAKLFADNTYAAELESQLSSWLDANPPGIGINWVTPMEVGIRAVNLVWAVSTLEEWRPLHPDVRDRLITSLRWHGRHIAANLEGTPFLRSNHYLGDILGLLVLGATLVGEPQAPRWFDFARRAFEREIRKQVHDDGVSFEASLAYHGLVLEMFLIATSIASWVGRPFSHSFHERLRQMVEASRSLRHPNGRIPLFGDQDSGRILPAGFARPPTHDNLLWAAAAVIGEARPLEGPVHPEVAWTFGIQAWERVAELPAAPPAAPAAFLGGGVFALRSPRAHLAIRCGDVGQNGSGGHSHNDMLSYEVSLEGEPLVVDSGTYAYTFDVEARNLFRSTRAHNTVVVDGQEINPIDRERVFELRGFARYTVEAVELDAETLQFVASHDGFRRLPDPVVHRRRFVLTPATGEVKVEDEIIGKDVHDVQSLLHFPPNVSVRGVGDRRYQIQATSLDAELSFYGFDAREIQIERGWVSDRYGVREDAPVLVIRKRGRAPLAFGYAITPGARLRATMASLSTERKLSRLTGQE
jgi:Heparinase II/III-like protein/Heparinase II/III N-terminus